MPLPGTANGGTAPAAPPHLIWCGSPLWRGGDWPGPPAFGELTEQPGIDGITPLRTMPTVCTRTPSQWPEAATCCSAGASLALSR